MIFECSPFSSLLGAPSRTAMACHTSSFALAPAMAHPVAQGRDNRNRNRRPLPVLGASRTPPPGLAFTADVNLVKPHDACSVAGKPNNSGHAAKLKTVFASGEGIVVGAFARVDGDDDDTQKEPTARRFPGTRSLVQFGFDLIAGDGDVDGKILIGFARAATDGSMVATIDEVTVSNQYRNRGVGTRLITKIASELRVREIYDVGARVPGASKTFFEKCGFKPDVEGAVLMRLAPETIDTRFTGKFDPARELKRKGVVILMLGAMEKADEAKDG